MCVFFFFFGAVCRELPLIVLAFLYSSTLLRFFAQRVFWDELLRRSGAGVVLVFFKENAIVLPENPAAKSSLFVSLVFLELFSS